MFYSHSSTPIFHGSYNQINDEFYFTDWSFGLATKIWNEELGKYEYKEAPGSENFNLILKRSK
jgi:hypothetical protein